MKRSFLLIIATLLFAQLNAQTISQQEVDKAFGNRVEVYFKAKVADLNMLQTLAHVVSIDEFDSQENTLTAYANREEFAEFLALNIPFEVQTPPGMLLKNPPMMTFQEYKQKAKGPITSYPTYPAYEAMMASYASTYPNLCKLYEVGTLSSGRKIHILKITDNPDIRENEPQFLYTATMHGDETAGYIFMLNLIEELLGKYGTDPELTSMVNNIEIWINPLANPDGTYAGGNSTVYSSTRYNSNGVDLNRNYPDPVDGPHPDGNAWQEETILFMGLADTMDFVMAANIHGGAELLNYPWDTWYQYQHAHADIPWWELVCHEYADTAQALSPSGYFTGPGGSNTTGVTLGSAWYRTTGSRQDYMNYWQSCREVTLEVSSAKVLPASQLSAYWAYSYRPLVNYIKQVQYGFRGIVTDSCSGSTLYAKIFVNNHDVDSSWVFTSMPLGNYHRPIKAKATLYSVTYSAAGYQSKTYDINIGDYYTTVQDVALNPLPPSVDFKADETQSCTGVITFTDLSQAPAGCAYEWDFGDGNTSTQENPQHAYAASGTYTVSLKVNNPCNNDADSLVKIQYINVNMPTMPAITEDSSCGADSLILQAIGNGTPYWYDQISGGTLLDTGLSFTTPMLSASTTYYVENVVESPSQYVGPQDNTIGAGNYFTGTQFLIFDVFANVRLKSVKVYANGVGNRTINIYDQTGSVVHTKTINIPDGESRVVLDFDLVPGTNYQIGAGSNSDLFRNSNGTSFPYALPGMLSIKGSTASQPGYYYFFYDWELAYPPCSSPRIPVDARIDNNAPTASFTYNGSGQTVNFISASNGGWHYSWDFGDGNFSTDENPTHTYAVSGNYNVTLIVYNACGSDTASLPIVTTVTEISDAHNQVKVFPNPVENKLSIFELNENEFHKLKLISIEGKLIMSKEIGTGNKSYQLDMVDIPAGMYILSLNSGKVVRHIRIQKQ